MDNQSVRNWYSNNDKFKVVSQTPSPIGRIKGERHVTYLILKFEHVVCVSIYIYLYIYHQSCFPAIFRSPFEVDWTQDNMYVLIFIFIYIYIMCV